MQAVSRNHRLASGTDGLHVGDCKDIGSEGGIGGMLPPAEYIVKISQRKKEQMKYDDLEAVKQYLYGKVENKNTARKMLEGGTRFSALNSATIGSLQER